MKLHRIISGGQTGVDRGGLEAAMELGLDHGGSCPAGRRAEDGVIPARYVMEEHTSSKYPPRTAKNICDADATLILIPGKRVTPGTRLTAKIAHERGKPWLAVNVQGDLSFDKVVEWLREIDPAVLNIAGPRESKFRGIQQASASFIGRVIERLRET
jgi:hypothetical protein